MAAKICCYSRNFLCSVCVRNEKVLCQDLMEILKYEPIYQKKSRKRRYFITARGSNRIILPQYYWENFRNSFCYNEIKVFKCSWMA